MTIISVTPGCRPLYFIGVNLALRGSHAGFDADGPVQDDVLGPSRAAMMTPWKPTPGKL